MAESAWCLARGEYIAYLNPGDTYRRDYLAILVEQLHRRQPINQGPLMVDQEIDLSSLMHRRSAFSHLMFQPSDSKANKPFRCVVQNDQGIAIYSSKETDGNERES